MVKKSTCKSITEHAMDVLNGDTMERTYVPKTEPLKVVILPESKPIRKKIAKQLLF